MAAARIQRWALILSAYDYAIQYKEGIQNANADALSRLPLPDTPGSTPVPEETILLMELLETTPIRAGQVKNWTKRTPILARVLKFIKQGWLSKCPDGEFQPYFQRRDELSVQDDCILWGNRVVVPPQGRRQVVDELHETHPGICKMKSLARSYVWWPNMDNDLENKVRTCIQRMWQHREQQLKNFDQHLQSTAFLKQLLVITVVIFAVKNSKNFW